MSRRPRPVEIYDEEEHTPALPIFSEPRAPSSSPPPSRRGSYVRRNPRWSRSVSPDWSHLWSQKPNSNPGSERGPSSSGNKQEPTRTVISTASPPPQFPTPYNPSYPYFERSPPPVYPPRPTSSYYQNYSPYQVYNPYPAYLQYAYPQPAPYTFSDSAPPAPDLPDLPETNIQPMPSAAPSISQTYDAVDNPDLISDNINSAQYFGELQTKVNYTLKIRSTSSTGHEKDDFLPHKPRVNTRLTFNREEESPIPEVYEIIQTKLVTKSSEKHHDFATLVFGEKGSMSEADTRWIHIKSASMNLEVFRNEAMRINGISEVTRLLIWKVFRHLRSKEKSFIHGKFFDSMSLNLVPANDKASSGKSNSGCSVAFFALPFLSLQSLDLPSDAPTTSHPVRSLLQFQYSFESTKRQDKRQIILESGESKDALHVPQAWMLLINGNIILSMSPTELKELQGDRLILEKAASSGLAAGAAQVRVIDLDGKEYCVPKTRCQTWFEFVYMIVGAIGHENPMSKSLYDDSWKESFELQSSGVLVSEVNWSDIEKRTDDGDVVIHIRLKERERPQAQPNPRVEQVPSYMPPSQPIPPLYPPFYPSLYPPMEFRRPFVSAPYSEVRPHSPEATEKKGSQRRDDFATPTLSYEQLQNQLDMFHKPAVPSYSFNLPDSYLGRPIRLRAESYNGKSLYSQPLLGNGLHYPGSYGYNALRMPSGTERQSLDEADFSSNIKVGFQRGSSRRPRALVRRSPEGYPRALAENPASTRNGLSREIENTAIVRHPELVKEERKRKIEPTREQSESAWQRKEQPIRLQDPDGVVLVVPWRIARDWEKMRSVIQQRIHERSQHWSDFDVKKHCLIGPSGPIAPSEWRQKAFPGCKIEFKNSQRELSPPRRPTVHIPDLSPSEKSSTGSESSAVTVVPRSTTPRPQSEDKTEEADQPDMHSLHESPVASPSLSFEDIGQSTDDQNVSPAVAMDTPQHCLDSTCGTNDHLELNVDMTSGSTPEAGSCDDGRVGRDDEDEPVKRLQRKNTDLQSFVEDVTDDEDYPQILTRDSTKGVELDTIDDESDHIEISGEPLSRKSSSNESGSHGLEQLAQEIPSQKTGPLFVQPTFLSSTESLPSMVHEPETNESPHVNVWDYLVTDDDDSTHVSTNTVPFQPTSVLDYLIIPQETRAIDELNPFDYQDRNDVWTIKSTMSLHSEKFPYADSLNSGPAEAPSNGQTPSSPTGISFGEGADTLNSPNTNSCSGKNMPTGNTEEKKLCPIFAWKPDSVDGAQIHLSEIDVSEIDSRVPDQFKDIDRNIRALLEEQDHEASWAVDNGRERATVEHIPNFSRMQLLVLRETLSIRLMPLERRHVNRLAGRRTNWELKEKVMSEIVGILNAFVPEYYQDSRKYWVVAKFYGAAMKIATEDFSDSYLESIEQHLSYFHEKLEQTQAGVSGGPAGELTKSSIPQALVDTFSPLLFYICACTQTRMIECPEWDSLRERASRIREDLRDARFQLMNMISTGDYSEAKVFRRLDAQAMITLVIDRLVRMPREFPTPRNNSLRRFDLFHVYRGQIERLELQARQSPNFETFDQIQQLREELSILDAVFDQQLDFVEQMSQVWDFSKQSKRQFVQKKTQQIHQYLRNMKHDVDELDRLAEKASKLLRSMIEVRKESNSKAITIFTIVTVVFLPLSFVTSYLGMNSVDIRDGTFNQSLFWIVALPSAASMIFILWVLIKFRRRVRGSWMAMLKRLTSLVRASHSQP